MGLLPDTQNCGCACAGNAGNVFPVTAGKRSRHASRHVRHARAVMHAGIANWRFPFKSAAGENVPGIPGACATRNFAYLARGPWTRNHIHYKVGWNYFRIPNFNGCAVDVWDWLSNIPNFIVHVITYPYYDFSFSMLVKGDPGEKYP